MKGEIPDCVCLWPYPGPLYWDWRCRRCSGRIVSLKARLAARRALASNKED
jgi:hypothetical protein